MSVYTPSKQINRHLQSTTTAAAAAAANSATQLSPNCFLFNSTPETFTAEGSPLSHPLLLAAFVAVCHRHEMKREGGKQGRRHKVAHLVANSSGMQCNRVAAATSWQSLTAAHSTTTKENEGGYYYKATRKWLKSTQMRPASVMNKMCPSSWWAPYSFSTKPGKWVARFKCK